MTTQTIKSSYTSEEYDHIDIGNKMEKYYYSYETLMEMEHCRFAFKSFQSDILVGSCNGLVCFEKEDSYNNMPEPFAICNPLTGKFIFLKPNFSRVWEEEAVLVSSGFGYCQSTNQYKVVRIYALNGEESHVQVYTIGSSEWRDMETCIRNNTFPSPGIFANGVLHWLDAFEGGISHIASFDLEDEKFRSLPLPPSEELGRLDSSHNKLNLLGGNLCWVQSQYRPTYNIDIWVYKRKTHNTNNTHKLDYYSKNSWNWVKEFSIKSRLEPIQLQKAIKYYCWAARSIVMTLKLKL
ncbi:F-box protein At3g07870-like [Papaver somniferum]|uniref:F-box protein At3g07870-like n=1 Tax=Papaver somniferum TaxID=3469 RepID=UPI000E6FDDFF|nr:F-box protein At3g07870-like [Papaver somniferum]